MSRLKKLNAEKKTHAVIRFYEYLRILPKDRHVKYEVLTLQAQVKKDALGRHYEYQLKTKSLSQTDIDYFRNSEKYTKVQSAVDGDVYEQKAKSFRDMCQSVGFIFA